MRALDRNDIIRIVKNLDELIEDTGKLMNEVGGEPTRNSHAVVEHNTFERPRSVTTVLSQGTLLAEVAGDQLMTLVRSLTEPVQTISPWTLLRGIVESSALSIWFLDPAIGPRMRVQRSFAFRFEGLEQQRKWIRVAYESELDNLATRMKAIEKVALELGFERICDRNGRQIGLGQIMPSVTEVIRDTLDEEATYRVSVFLIHHFRSAGLVSTVRYADESHAVQNRER